MLLSYYLCDIIVRMKPSISISLCVHAIVSFPRLSFYDSWLLWEKKIASLEKKNSMQFSDYETWKATILLFTLFLTASADPFLTTDLM